MRTLWFTAFAICGIAFYVWIETWAQAHREAMERLLEESDRTHCLTAEDDPVLARIWDNEDDAIYDTLYLERSRNGEEARTRGEARPL